MSAITIIVILNDFTKSCEDTTIVGFPDEVTARQYVKDITQSPSEMKVSGCIGELKIIEKFDTRKRRKL